MLPARFALSKARSRPGFADLLVVVDAMIWESDVDQLVCRFRKESVRVQKYNSPQRQAGQPEAEILDHKQDRIVVRRQVQ